MRERVIACDKFKFIDILDVSSHKTVNEHAAFYIKGHIIADTNENMLHNAAGKSVSFTATGADGDKKLFCGLISNIDIHTENEVCTLAINAVSQSTLMDIDAETRTFQDSDMAYQDITKLMEEKNSKFNFFWPSNGASKIGSMMVQYKETDWQYAMRLAGSLGTVVVPDYLLDNPYISIGMLKKTAKATIDAISYSIKKDIKQFRDNKFVGNFSENDAISYIVKSREIYDLCDSVTFLGKTLYVYAIDTMYEGEELVHCYTLKEESGFYTKQTFNENLIGASMRGTVTKIREDKVQIRLNDDVEQSGYKWFPYATPFSQPDGYGWYFMPEVGDEVRLQFPSEQEHDAYVSSAVHVSYGNRQAPQTKYIRTIYGQVIQFDPNKILIADGAGSSITMHKKQGISMDTDKTVKVDAQSDITISAFGKVVIAGESGVVMQKNDSVISIDDAIDISSEHTRVQ